MPPKQLYDHLGRTVVLAKELGAGGEGKVFALSGDTSVVAKVYHKPVNAEKAAKLQILVQAAATDLLTVAAWPTATLHSHPGGPVVGLVMPRIDKPTEIHKLYSPANRRQAFPDADWRFLIRAATNSAISFEKLHQRAVVIGDVNQGNVLVAQNATVRLIDCDSFQVRVHHQLFRCEVGVPHFTPPELQGKNFRTVERTANHDLFGLSVIIFHLLFMGRHPFAGRYSGAGDMPIERAIQQFRFAYSANGSRLQMSPPPHAVTLSALPSSLSQMFERAFGPNSVQPDARPRAGEWVTTLGQLERSLRVCPQDSGHYFSSHLSRCPWCDVIRSGGPNFFISVTIQTALRSSSQFDLAITWTAIEQTPPPPSQYVSRGHIRRAIPIGQPLPPDILSPTSLSGLVGWICIAATSLCLLSLPFPLLLLFATAIAAAFAVWWKALNSLSPISELARQRSLNLRTKLDAVHDMEMSWQRTAQYYHHMFNTSLANLGTLRQQHDQSKSSCAAEMVQLQSNAAARQLQVFLDRHDISDASISLVGPGRKATLVSYGIETANDVNSAAIQNIPGFGAAITRNLIAWRLQIEQKFRFDPIRGVPQADIDAIRMKYFQKSQQTTMQLQQGPAQLLGITETARRALGTIEVSLAQLDVESDQARADAAISAPKKANRMAEYFVVGTLLISFLVLMNSRILSHLEATPNKVEGEPTQERLMSKPISTVTKSTKEDSERLAREAYNRGKQHKELGEYIAAANAYSEAISLHPSLEAVKARAFCLVKLGRYQDAIDDYTLWLSSKPPTPPPTELAKVYSDRGHCKYQLRQNDAAIIDFTKAIEIDPKSAEAYHYRGAARQSKEEYELAIADFGKAIELTAWLTSAYQPQSTRSSASQRLAIMYRNRANVYRMMGKLTPAQQDESKATLYGQ